MVVSKEDAVQALAEIGAARERTEQLRGYRNFGPHAMIWGSVWMLANTLIGLQGSDASLIWLVLNLLGAAASMTVGARARSAMATTGSRSPGDTPPGSSSVRWGASRATMSRLIPGIAASCPRVRKFPPDESAGVGARARVATIRCAASR